jgi:transcriptional regulator with XRE-family HTH domain
MRQTFDDQARARIRAWIESTQTTQTDLAARIGRNQAWMSRYLNGEFGADLETLHRIAQVFGHSLISLLDIPRDPQVESLLDELLALPPDERATLLKFLRLQRVRRSRSGRSGWKRKGRTGAENQSLEK